MIARRQADIAAAEQALARGGD